MPRMSDKRKRELAFFLTESGRVAYNKLCLSVNTNVSKATAPL